jgi:hypothetical protein
MTGTDRQGGFKEWTLQNRMTEVKKKLFLDCPFLVLFVNSAKLEEIFINFVNFLKHCGKFQRNKNDREPSVLDVQALNFVSS